MNPELFEFEYHNPEFFQLRTFLGNGYQSVELSNSLGQGIGACELNLSPFPIMRIAGVYSFGNLFLSKKGKGRPLLNSIARGLNAYGLLPIPPDQQTPIDLEEIDGTMLENFSQKLDIQKAVVTTKGNIGSLQTTTEIFLSRSLPNIGILKMTVARPNPGDQEFLHLVRKDPMTDYESIAFSEINSGKAYWEIGLLEDKNELDRKGIFHFGQITGVKVLDEWGNTLQFSLTWSKTDEKEVHYEGTPIFAEKITASCPKPSVDGQYRWVFELYFGYVKERDQENPMFYDLPIDLSLRSRAEQILTQAMTDGWDTCFNAHVKAWKADIWDHQIELPGADPEIQKMVNSCFYIIGCTYLNGLAYGNGPNGITGQAWDGRTFWDHDLWVNLGILLWAPDLAKNFNYFRYNTMKGAEENRKEYVMALDLLGILQKYGLKITEGIKYPWESTSSGLERCPHELGTGATIQEHIVCDVIHGMWLQWLVQQDRQYLENIAFPVAYQSALYLGQRINKEADGKWHFRYILPADEFAIGGVHDNAFTNLYVEKCMKIVIDWCKLLGKDYPKHWEEIACNMKYHFDAKNKRIIEHEEYEDETIKQADVDLLTWPLEAPILYKKGGEEIRRNNMLFYYSRLPPGHIMMGACIFSIVAAELNMLDKAWEYFADQFPHFHPKQSYIPSESPNNTCWPFITGIGGFCANLIYGFGGIRLRDDGLLFSPILPKELPEINFHNLVFQGSNLNYRVLKGGSQFVLKNLGPDTDFRVYCRKSRVFLPKDQPSIQVSEIPGREEISYRVTLKSGKEILFQMQ